MATKPKFIPRPCSGAFAPLALLALAALAPAQAQDTAIVHDAEFYVLQAQHGERWAAED